jgi:hypothetical protein
MPKQSVIGRLASAETKKQFAAELAQYTSLSSPEVEALFPKEQDREELLRLLEIVGSASDDNDKKARIIEHAGKIAGAVLKITKRFATGL